MKKYYIAFSGDCKESGNRVMRQGYFSNPNLTESVITEVQKISAKRCNLVETSVIIEFIKEIEVD